MKAFIFDCCLIYCFLAFKWVWDYIFCIFKYLISWPSILKSHSKALTWLKYIMPLLLSINSESFCYIITYKSFFNTGSFYSNSILLFLPVSRLAIVYTSSGIVYSCNGLKFFPLFINSFKTLYFIKSKFLLFKYS